MNKVKVIYPFTDKANNGASRSEGDVLEVSDARLKVLLGENENKRAYVELIDEPKDMTVAELKAELDAKGIEYDAKAKKAELIELLGE